MDTIIVDDEEKALDLLQFHLENYFSDYSIIARYSNFPDALEGILKTKPEVVFLDINMPSGSGVDLLAKIKHLNISIVFLTAHSEYAIEAIKHNAFDYLLKPINIEELTRVDAKIRERKWAMPKYLSKKIKIQISNQVYLFEPDEILFASSEGNYTTIYSQTQNPIIITKNLKKIEELHFSELPFFRSHQSFIVNINHILNYSNFEIILCNNYKVQLSSKKYHDLTKLIP